MRNRSLKDTDIRNSTKGPAGMPGPSSLRADFAVTGMHCAACAGTVEKTVQNMPGVESAQVNFALRKLAVVFRPGEVDPAAMAAKVHSAGYELVVDPGARGGGAAGASRDPALQDEEVVAARRTLMTSILLSAV